MGLSVRDMAKALGVSKSQVSRDKLAGMPMSDAASATAWREANRDFSRGLDTPPAAVGGLASAAGAGAAGAAPASSEDGDVQPGDTAEYRRHRTEIARIRKEREQHELNRDLGLSIDLAEAQRLAFTTFRGLRDQALSVPARVKDLVAAMTDAAEIERLLEAELTAVFSVDVDKLLADAEDEEDDDAG